MAGNVKLKAVSVVTSMMDDMKVDMHVAVLIDGVAATALPAGMNLSWTPADANITVNPAVDITGAPSTDPLAAIAMGVKGKAASTSISASTTNPDQTVATCSFPFTITIDPLESDVSDLTGSVGTPVKQ